MSTPFGASVVLLRKRKGWSQEDLATHSGLARKTVGHIETGGDCRGATLFKLAVALDVPAEKFGRAYFNGTDLLADLDAVEEAPAAVATAPKATASTSLEIAGLRHAVEDLAHRVNTEPAYRAPDRLWVENISHEKFGEWDIRGRSLSVRAGKPDAIPSVFLVDQHGDMHALSIGDTYRLIEALSSAVGYVRDDLTERRAKRVTS